LIKKILKNKKLKNSSFPKNRIEGKVQEKTKNFDEDFEPGSKLHKLDSCYFLFVYLFCYFFRVLICASFIKFKKRK